MDHSTVEETVYNLRDKGYRITGQREKIIALFYSLPEGAHLSAEELKQLLEERNIRISLATLYRTLNLLSDLGILKQLDFVEDHKHYELNRLDKADHQHLICISCNKTIEFDSPETIELGISITEKNKFKLTDVQLKVFGYCERCSN